MNKQDVLTQVILLAILVCIIIFLVISYESLQKITDIQELKIKILEKKQFIEKSKGENMKEPNSETTCGEGTIEIGGICYAPNKINTNYSFSSKIHELVLES